MRLHIWAEELRALASMSNIKEQIDVPQTTYLHLVIMFLPTCFYQQQKGQNF